MSAQSAHSITTCPHDVVSAIILMLPIGDILSLRQCCRKLSSSVDTRYIWLMLYQAILSVTPCSPALSSPRELSHSVLRNSVLRAFNVETNWRKGARNTESSSKVLQFPAKVIEVALMAGGDWIVVHFVNGAVSLWNLDGSGEKVPVIPQEYNVAQMKYFPSLCAQRSEILVTWRRSPKLRIVVDVILISPSRHSVAYLKTIEVDAAPCDIAIGSGLVALWGGMQDHTHKLTIIPDNPNDARKIVMKFVTPRCQAKLAILPENRVLIAWDGRISIYDLPEFPRLDDDCVFDATSHGPTWTYTADEFSGRQERTSTFCGYYLPSADGTGSGTIGVVSDHTVYLVHLYPKACRESPFVLCLSRKAYSVGRRDLIAMGYRRAIIYPWGGFHCMESYSFPSGSPLCPFDSSNIVSASMKYLPFLLQDSMGINITLDEITGRVAILTRNILSIDTPGSSRLIVVDFRTR